MSLVWLTISKTLEKSIAMVNVWSGRHGWLKPRPILCARERRRRKRWSGCVGSHVGWGGVEGINIVLDEEGVLELEQQGSGRI